MPIMAANGQSDARGAAWLLAAAAKDCMEDPSRGPDQETALNNTFRLLESFRSNAFFAFERKPYGRTSLGSESLTLTVPSQSHLGDVSSAIQRSIAAAFGGVDSNDAINAVEDTLRRVADPDKFGHPEGDSLERATTFFRELQSSLEAA